jgi:hypothetical protein
MHIKEQIKTKPFIVPSIYDNPIPRNTDNNPLVTVATFPAVLAASTTSKNICSLSVPENCLGIVVFSGVLYNCTGIRLPLVSRSVWFQISTDNRSLILAADTFSGAVKFICTVRF